jgi:hypothetical protein
MSCERLFEPARRLLHQTEMGEPYSRATRAPVDQLIMQTLRMNCIRAI